MFIFCVKAALLAKRGSCSVFCLLVFRKAPHVYVCIAHVAAQKQRPCLSNTGCWFRQFLVIYRCLDKGGRGGGGGSRLHTAPTPPFCISYALVQATSGVSRLRRVILDD